MLAWAAQRDGVNEHQTFMPLIVSFHLGLLLAAAALVRAAEEAGDTNHEVG